LHLLQLNNHEVFQASYEILGGGYIIKLITYVVTKLRSSV